MKRVVALLLSACLLCGLLSGCGDDGSGKGFRLPLGAEPTQLDPQVATDTASVTLLSALFEGLTRLDESGKAVPAAADWTVSADGLTYTFTLRESYWSTLKIRGEETPWDAPTPVVADDFVFGLERARKEGTLPFDAAVEAQGNKGLTITLKKPNDELPVLLSTTPCMPCDREFFAYTAGRYGLEKVYLLCNGPFALTAWNHDESLLLHKNESYHGTANVLPEAVRFVIGAEDGLAQLQAGTLDVAALTDKQATAYVAAGGSVTELQDTVRSLWFNTAAVPMTVPAIRQALRDSIQWDTVYTHLQEAGESPAVGYVPPAATVGGEIYRREDNRRPFKTDVAAARRALGVGLAALYPEEVAPSLPTIKVVAADDEASANLARYIIQSWQKNLGLSVSLSTVPVDRLAKGFVGGAHAIITAYTPTGLTGAENLTMFTADGAGNISRYSDKAVDTAVVAALRGGRQELDALETLLWQQCPCLPLSYPKRYYGIAVGVEGITVRPFGGGAYGSPFDFLQAKKWD
ncbi:MAG: peptide ABC transporter substrate-binding protein [Clostridia bacterium]|nr:peptide ABC transporter substrate-binding protein [Clostridia bacterium]